MNILGKKILIITAHPDDETFLAGGTVYENKRKKGKTFLYCATLGEKGKAYFKKNINEKELAKIRKKELQETSKYLKVDKIYFGKFKDKELEYHKENLKEEIMNIISKSKPDYILGFGKDGITGHHDHIVIGQISKSLAKKFKIQYIAFTNPPKKILKNFHQHLKKKKIHGKYINAPIPPEPNICIQINRNIKLKALKKHKSQFPGLNPFVLFPKEIAEHILNFEYFYIEKNLSIK